MKVPPSIFTSSASAGGPPALCRIVPEILPTPSALGLAHCDFDISGPLVSPCGPRRPTRPSLSGGQAGRLDQGGHLLGPIFLGHLGHVGRLGVERGPSCRC